MQQNAPVKKELQICSLSKEEIEDPYIVFTKLFKNEDLIGLSNLNSDLFRAAMKDDEYEKLSHDEKRLVTVFSTEVCRMLEALHLLSIGGEADSKQDIPSSSESLSVCGGNKEPSKKENCKPMYLTEKEMENPRAVIENFTSAFSFSSVNEQLEQMKDICVTSDATQYSDGRSREDLLYVTKNILKVLEAVYVLINSMKGAKIIVHDFRAPSFRPTNKTE